MCYTLWVLLPGNSKALALMFFHMVLGTLYLSSRHLANSMEMNDKPIDEALREFQTLFRMPVSYGGVYRCVYVCVHDVCVGVCTCMCVHVYMCVMCMCVCMHACVCM